MRGTLIIFASFIAAVALHCSAFAGQNLGNFIIGSKEIRLGDGAGMYASTFAPGLRQSLTIQCSSETGGLTVFLADAHPAIRYLERVSIEVFADGTPVVKTIGVRPPESDYEKAMTTPDKDGRLPAVLILWNLIVQDSEPIIASIAEAKEVSFHLVRSNGEAFDLAFPLIEAKRVVSLLRQKGCAKGPFDANITAALPEAGDWGFGTGGLSLFNRANYVEFICDKYGDGHLFVHKRNIGENADYSKPIVTYSVDGAPDLQISGETSLGGNRIDFDKHALKQFVSDLLNVKDRFSFAVGVKKDKSLVDFSNGLIHEDIQKLLERCNLILLQP